MKKAFTLAEVLLVLAIIGVIAALTVPNLVTSNMDKKYVALAKKAQTTLQQAIDTKMGDAALGTNKMGMGLLAWLATAQGNVPAVLRVSNSSGTRYLTTDGILYNDLSNRECDNANVCYIRVDLDGAAGITNSVVGGNIAGDTTTARDVIELECRKNFIAPSDRNNQPAQRAREYLGFEEND
ncbi:prepilin-type N-terminal cleavage/methylation domain-containing protein [bacterium]|nr:prepilin-type N-terminal cleavage/methylation domain-containing protein [bacterium]